MALRVEERIVAGDEGELLVVHHLVLRGSNRAIGRHLGEIARTRYRLTPQVAPDPARARVQREWVRQHAPLLFERMRGIADAFCIDLAGDGHDLARLGAAPPTFGGSAVFVPPHLAHDGGPLVSRAFDGEAPPTRSAPGTPPAASRPYVLENYPDEGYPSLAVVAFNLLGAALDGVNAEGLAVVAASDLEARERGALEPDPAAIGLDELQIGRFLLDTCASAAEAREAVLAVKHHYITAPVHWLVVDRRGDAFVFEIGPGRNRVHLVDAADRPLVLTNHPLHRYPKEAGLPRLDGPGRTYARYRALRGALAETALPWSAAALALAAERAFARPEAGAERTLWHGIYGLRERPLDATFFERDEPDPARAGGLRAARTLPLRFQLTA
jgi:hypothetical protein